MSDIVDELREIQRMNTTLHGAHMAVRAADEIERLREMLHVQFKMVLHYFEERDEARRERDEARRERDEARRELCAARRELCRNEAFIRLQRHRVHRDSEDVVGLAKEIAVERGWDCFKENA